MPTNNFPNIGFTTHGRDFNFFTKLTVSTVSFGGSSVDGYQPDTVITFPTYAVTFQLESGSSVEYSFNGTTVHGDMTSGKASATLIFENRVISKIWFRGTGVVRVEAWAIR